MPGSVRTRDAAASTNVILAAVVATLAIAAAFAVGVLAVGADSSSTPVITTVVGLFAPTIVGMLALVKAEKVDRKTDAVNDKVDGHLNRLTALAAEAAAASGDQALVDRVVHDERSAAPPESRQEPGNAHPA